MTAQKTPLTELILKNRTYRRFDQSVKVGEDTLLRILDTVRTLSSGRNAQPLKYILVSTEEGCQTVFDHIMWAGALPDWPGPAEGEKPTAYIIPFRDNKIAKDELWDLGIATEAISLLAVEAGFGCCQFGAVKFKDLTAALGVTDENLEMLCVIAVGKPVENVVLADLPESGAFQYYRDEEMNHYVPKRKLEDIIIDKK
jgi:nitroreductase